MMRVGRLRQVLVHRAHDFIGRMRTGDCEHARVRVQHHVALRAEAAGDDDLAVFDERFTDGVERFRDRAVDEAAGVDHHEVRILIARRDEITLRAQLREDAFGIDECFGAAE